MKNLRLILAFLLLSPILFGTFLFPTGGSNIGGSNEYPTGIPEGIDNMKGVDELVDAFGLSQDTQEGVIRPVQIVESGFKETDPLRARTDTGTDTIQNITIDDDNDWVANYTSIEVSNIKRLYGINGTFEDGVEPWTNYTVAGGDDIQIADYDADGEYIICRNVGEYKWASKHTWVHTAGSEIGFKQVVYNTKGELEFDLRYDFRYATGPIDPEGDNLLPSVVGAFYQINRPTGEMYQGYYYPMNEYLLSREAWYSVAHTFTLPSAWAEFSFAVGLYLAGTITLDNVTDYDDDPLAQADGTENAQNLTVYIDNVEFTGVAIPTPENVGLTFHAGTYSEAITGSGVGTASISNPDCWTVDPLEIQITSNTTVAFTYSVTTLYLRIINSSWTTYLPYQGVSYSIDAGQNADLEYYTYVTTSSGYDDQTIEIEFPKDWENTTIWDPLQNDITGLCSLSTGRIFIPTSLFTRVGWWKITHQSLNYAKSIDIQIYDSPVWTTGSLFRTGNLTRTQVELGTLSETPSSGSSVSINWIMPNGTIWFADSISSIIGGVVTSSQLSLGGMNTSAGQWEVQVFWNNGTEIAYGVDTFDLYHQASASAHYPSIETDYGYTIANQIILTDSDNGLYLLDDSVSISANWSSSTVDFIPNFAKNWWQADFDTSELGNGEYTVVVDITRPFFDPISVQFTVIITFETSLTITNAGPGIEENNLFNPFTVQLNFELWNGTGIEGAYPSVTYSGPQEGIQWKAFTDLGNGLYSIDIISNISTTYEITITLSKPYHYNASDSFSLAINEIDTELILVNGTADIVQYGDTYRLVVEYRNSTGYGLTGANLQIVTITPSIGLTNTSFTYLTGGFYEVTFSPYSTGTYSIVISASLFNHETRYSTFTLTGVVIPSILTAIPSSASISVNETFILQLSFEDEHSNPIDSAIIELMNPPSGISVSSAVWDGSSLYNITIRSSEIDIYNLLFRASATNYQSSIVGFTISVTEIDTELILVNGTAGVVQYGDSYRLVVEYRNITGYGLLGANLQIVSITPSTGLLNSSFAHISGGFYEVTFTPTITGTYAIIISADCANHEIQYRTFSLTGIVIPSVLTSIPSSASIAVNETFILQLHFEDEDNNPIDTATIDLIVTPSGIFISDPTPVGGGLYNITIRSSEIDIYNLLFRASATNYQSSIVGFTVSVTALHTTLDITNAGTIPEETGLNEVFTVYLSYQLTNGTGVPGALASLIFTGPSEGLHPYNFIDNNNGLYSIDIICNVSATYGISITMSKAYHYNTTDSFTLIVGETGSELELLNGTADVVLFGNSYKLIIEYRNSTGFGLAGADVLVISVTPTTGLVHTNFSHIVDGFYEITLTPSAAGTFSIVISADIINHETQYATFTITASGIPTILTSLPSEYTVAINQTFVLQLRFLDESLNPIDGATVTILSPPVGLTVSPVVPAGNGYYNITLESSLIQTFDLLFRASMNNYQSSSAGFTFVVTEIQTSLRFGGDVSSVVVEFADPYELIVYYERTNPSQAVQGANITVLPDIPELEIQVSEYVGYYIISIKGIGIGSWVLSIVADKTNYRFATKSFFIEVEEIDTSIQGSSPLETLYIGRSYTFTFDFIFESNSSNIFGATISPSGGGADWVTYIELGSGQYAVNLTPLELGEHSVTLTFEKLGFDSAVYRITFEVGRIPISVEVLQGLNGPENSESIVTVRITESDTGHPVSGLEVFCYIVDPNGAPSSSYALIETETLGDYSGVIPMPVAEGEYHLLIECEGENYIMTSEFTADLSPARNVVTMLWITTTRYYPILIGLFALCAGLVYRRSARRRRIRENKEALSIKRRFDDVRSLLGVIVLHKDSGLPVYSKILREGLEETVISAFITAITSFRGEFDIETSSEEWGLIPISDIVRVISTNKLVCAFITTGNPSPEQRERMIQFAKTVGFIFDETMEDVPVVVLDRHTTSQFDALFEDILDGQLLRTFKLDETKKFPTTSCANERIARKHGEEFKLEELASEIAACGLEEGRVYKAIMIALENHFLVKTDDSPFATELLRASDVIEEEG